MAEQARGGRVFGRALRLQLQDAGSQPEFANGGFSFRIVLEPGSSWHTCLFWMPELDGRRAQAPPRACHSLFPGKASAGALTA